MVRKGEHTFDHADGANFYRALVVARDAAVADSTLRDELGLLATRELELKALRKGTANGTFRMFIGTILAGFTVHLLNTAADEDVKLLYSELMCGLLDILLTSEYSYCDYKVFMGKLVCEDRDDYLKHLVKSCIDVCIENIMDGFNKVLSNSH